jgi:hypothetical protein
MPADAVNAGTLVDGDEYVGLLTGRNVDGITGIHACSSHQMAT